MTYVTIIVLLTLYRARGLTSVTWLLDPLDIAGLTVQCLSVSIVLRQVIVYNRFLSKGEELFPEPNGMW